MTTLLQIFAECVTEAVINSLDEVTWWRTFLTQLSLVKTKRLRVTR